MLGKPHILSIFLNSFNYLNNTLALTFDPLRITMLMGVWEGDDIIEPVHEISNNVVCVNSKASDQNLC